MTFKRREPDGFIVQAEASGYGPLMARFLNRRALVATGLCLLSLLMIWPLIRHGLPNTGDAPLHLFWHSAFFEVLSAGIIYPRWLHQAVWGLGAPIFFYYPPLPFYTSGLIEWILPAPRMPWYPLGLAVVLSLILSAVNCFIWLRRRTDSGAALIGALAYGISPYHLAIDVYFRAAYAEIWAFAWMPLVLYGHDLGKRSPLRGLCCTSIALTLLLFSHLPTALLFFPIAFCYGLFILERRFRAYAWLVATFSLGIAGAGLYLVPALTMVDWTQARKLWWEKLEFYFSPRELYWSFATHGFADYNGNIFIHHLALIPTLIILSAALIELVRRKRKPSVRANPLDWFWMTMALLMIFMFSPLSSKLWDWIPILKRVQFPWRFNAPLCVCFAWFTAWLWKESRESGIDVKKLALAMSLTGTVAVTTFVATDPSLFDRNLTRRDVASRMGAEFLPATAPFPANPQGWAAMFDHPRPSAMLAAQSAEVTINQWRSGHIELTYRNAHENDLLTVSQLYYPLWRAHQLDNGLELPLQPETAIGLIALRVPNSKGTIALDIETSRSQRIGAAMSVVSIVGLLLASIIRALQRRTIVSERRERR